MATFEKIAFTEVGAGGTSAIDFTVIPSTFTDLSIVLSLRTNRTNDATGDEVYVYFNNSNTSVSSRILYGAGSGSGASYSSASYIINLGADAQAGTSNTFGNMNVYIPNYAGSTNKSVSLDGVSENNATGAYASLSAGLWSNTAAINQVTFKPINGTTFLQYSSATLYGIKKA